MIADTTSRGLADERSGRMPSCADKVVASPRDLRPART